MNLTHGTGGEIDRYSVATIPENQVKVGIGYDCLYALYLIDDSSLMLNLPLDQSVYTAIDALNHAVEASPLFFLRHILLPYQKKRRTSFSDTSLL